MVSYYHHRTNWLITNIHCLISPILSSSILLLPDTAEQFQVKSHKQYHGVREDVESVGEFIRLYTTRFKRWSSPKFLIGESYGTTRAANLVNYLQEPSWDVFQRRDAGFFHPSNANCAIRCWKRSSLYPLSSDIHCNGVVSQKAIHRFARRFEKTLSASRSNLQ